MTVLQEAGGALISPLGHWTWSASWVSSTKSTSQPKYSLL